MYYKPSSEIDVTTGKPIAYSSIEHITNDLTLGWLVRGMHRWGASVFIILLFLHMGRVFLFGAYKYPRELNWIIGALILVMGMLMGFTGYLLPVGPDRVLGDRGGDQPERHGAVRGPWLAQFLAGGPEIGSDTLAKWYALHMLLIPGALIALIVVHLYLVARLGITSPPWSNEAAGRERPARKPTRSPRGPRSGPGRRRVDGQGLGEQNREWYARYKDDVKKEGKAFFPRAMLHDTVMGIVVLLVITGARDHLVLRRRRHRGRGPRALVRRAGRAGDDGFHPAPGLVLLLPLLPPPDLRMAGDGGHRDRRHPDDPARVAARAPVLRPPARAPAVAPPGGHGRRRAHVLSMGVLTYKGATAEESLGSS